MKAGVLSAVAGLVLVVALILAACSGTTAQCPRQANTTLGTISAGQVSIATDHSIYSPGDTIQATIVNHLPTGVAVNNYGFTASCPYFALQLRTGDDWQDMSACVPASQEHPEGNLQQLIAAGDSFSSIVILHSDLPAGAYRLWISSYAIDDAQGAVASRGTAESATFRICTCRACA